MPFSEGYRDRMGYIQPNDSQEVSSGSELDGLEGHFMSSTSMYHDNHIQPPVEVKYLRDRDRNDNRDHRLNDLKRQNKSPIKYVPNRIHSRKSVDGSSYPNDIHYDRQKYEPYYRHKNCSFESECSNDESSNMRVHEDDRHQYYQFATNDEDMNLYGRSRFVEDYKSLQNSPSRRNRPAAQRLNEDTEMRTNAGALGLKQFDSYQAGSKSSERYTHHKYHQGQYYDDSHQYNKDFIRMGSHHPRYIKDEAILPFEEDFSIPDTYQKYRKNHAENRIFSKIKAPGHPVRKNHESDHRDDDKNIIINIQLPPSKQDNLLNESLNPRQKVPDKVHTQSRWSSDNVVLLPKSKPKSEVALAATATAYLLSNDKSQLYDLNTAVQSVSKLLHQNVNTKQFSERLKSCGLDDQNEQDSHFHISYLKMQESIRSEITEASKEEKKTFQMDAYQFWARMTILVSLAIFKVQPNAPEVAHMIADAIMTFGVSTIKKNWIESGHNDLQWVASKMTDAIMNSPLGSETIAYEAVVTLLKEGNKSLLKVTNSLKSRHDSTSSYHEKVRKAIESDESIRKTTIAMIHRYKDVKLKSDEMINSHDHVQGYMNHTIHCDKSESREVPQSPKQESLSEKLRKVRAEKVRKTKEYLANLDTDKKQESEEKKEMNSKQHADKIRSEKIDLHEELSGNTSDNDHAKLNLTSDRVFREGGVKKSSGSSASDGIMTNSPDIVAEFEQTHKPNTLEAHDSHTDDTSSTDMTHDNEDKVQQHCSIDTSAASSIISDDQANTELANQIMRVQMRAAQEKNGNSHVKNSILTPEKIDIENHHITRISNVKKRNKFSLITDRCLRMLVDSCCGDDEPDRKIDREDSNLKYDEHISTGTYMVNGNRVARTSNEIKVMKSDGSLSDTLYVAKKSFKTDLDANVEIKHESNGENNDIRKSRRSKTPGHADKGGHSDSLTSAPMNYPKQVPDRESSHSTQSRLPLKRR